MNHVDQVKYPSGKHVNFDSKAGKKGKLERVSIPSLHFWATVNLWCQHTWVGEGGR